MAALSNYARNKILDLMLRAVAWSPPATVYVALYNTNPTAADTGIEVTGTGYARVASSYSAASSGATSNTGAITFPAAGGAWTQANYFGIRDAATGGNLLLFGQLDNPRTAAPTDVLEYAIGDLDVSMT